MGGANNWSTTCARARNDEREAAGLDKALPSLLHMVLRSLAIRWLSEGRVSLSLPGEGLVRFALATAWAAVCGAGVRHVRLETYGGEPVPVALQNHSLFCNVQIVGKLCLYYKFCFIGNI